MKKLYCILFSLLFSLYSTVAVAQEGITVSGTIKTSDMADGLPGAYVLVKGSTKGTVTDMDGRYSLVDIDPQATLVYSYLGYITQEVLVNGRTSIDITLSPDMEALDEVVVVGYGTQKKETLVSSVSTTKGEDLVKSPQANLTNSLTGRLSGVMGTTASGEPGFDGTQLLIRGKSSNGDNSPLIVVDGVASQLGGLDRLDPNNIESISVLKDASASIYGSRAANGVIIVTTKKGVVSPPSVTFSYNQGFIQATRIPKMANSQQYATILNEIQYYANPDGGMNQVYSAEELDKFANGSDPLNYPNTNWLDEVITPLSTQHQLSLSLNGGGPKVQYYLAFGNRKQESIYNKGITEYAQTNVRTNVDVKLTDNLKLGANINVRNEEGLYPTASAGNIFREAYRGKPTEVAYYPANGTPGDPNYFPGGYGVDAEGAANNPLALVTDIAGTNTQPKRTVNTVFNLDYKLPFAEFLSVKAFAALDYSTKETKVFQKPFVTYTPVSPRNLPSNYVLSDFNQVGNSVMDPQLRQRQENEDLATYHAALHFNKQFGKHYVTAFAAYEQSKFETNYLTAFRRGFATDVVEELDQGPVGIDENDAVYATNGGNSFVETRRNYFGRVTYDYESKYLFEAQLRYDGSSKFPKGNEYGLFWNVSGGWRISEEPFFNVDAINNLKLRASYGIIGNDRIPDFQFLNRYQNIGAGYVTDGFSRTRYVPAQIANSEITWEESQKLDIGLELTVFKNISLEASYFSERRNGLLITPNDYPWVSGIVNEWGATNNPNDNTPAIIPQTNSGETLNEGFEVQLTYNKTINNVDFFISGNATYAKNKVISLNDPETIDYKKVEGKPLGAQLYYQSIGIFRTPEDLENNPSLPGNQLGDLMYADVDGDGEITPNDQVRADKTNIPRLVYGITGGVKWKGFDFNFLLQGQGGTQQYFLPESGSIGNLTKTWADNRYSPSNTQGSYPRAVSRTSSSLSGGNATRNTFWLTNTAFLRIKNIELGYNIPTQVLNRVRLKSARIYVNALNLATFTSSDDFDPEVTNTQGHGYPQHKIYNIGTTISF
ncbi:TonB-dependent receptor [Flammeovirga sp. EKP202]|uniref:SusC/RagA family TonB-linked outer membrane protein n=1 Tax=Flammeovirga sp. EKP202 TaxID=2770592 RepID=UPI00165FE903|nr:TonB-dependent receptor [Flammeovirga sp. EKP202]MBD0404673.1 TonB-dependent receptor [Flammeovirga sp. EKP202]